jgi:hypothetical protein
MLRAIGIVCVLCSCGISQRARAQPTVDREAYSEPPRRRGTHFILDLTAGLAPSGDAGLAGGLGLGAGGRLPATPLRLYGIGELSFAQTHPEPALHALSIRSDERSYLGLAGGARLYVPLGGKLRLFFDVLAGASYNGAEISSAASTLQESDWFVMGALAGGAQYRLLHSLSLGLRAKWLVSEDPLWELRDALGLSNAFPFVLSAGVTWHF